MQNDNRTYEQMIEQMRKQLQLDIDREIICVILSNECRKLAENIKNIIKDLIKLKNNDPHYINALLNNDALEDDYNIFGYYSLSVEELGITFDNLSSRLSYLELKINELKEHDYNWYNLIIS